MVGVVAVLESSSSVGHGCQNTSTLCTLLKLERGFLLQTEVPGARGSRVCYPWQDQEQGRLCYVSAAQSGTTQLVNESPDGFHNVLNSSLSWVELKKAREEAQI